MSKFTTPLQLEFLENNKFKLIEAFTYYRTDDEKDIIRVPKNFITDFASIPRLFWNVLPPQGTKRNKYGKSAVLHDYLYDEKCKYKMSRRQADTIFIESMKAVKVNWFIRSLLYSCVRLFGKKHYRNPLGEA